MAKPKKPKAKRKPKPRNPVASNLAEGRYQPRKELPKKGKGSYRRKPARAPETE